MLAGWIRLILTHTHTHTFLLLQLHSPPFRDTRTRSMFSKTANNTLNIRGGTKENTFVSKKNIYLSL